MPRTFSIPATRSNTPTGHEAAREARSEIDPDWCGVSHSTLTSTPQRDAPLHSGTPLDALSRPTTTHLLCSLIVLLILALGLAFSDTAEAETSRSYLGHNAPKRGTVAYCKAHSRGITERACIIRVLWAPLGQSRKAVRVAWCESRLDPNASNGQYQGVFQMGSSERARFGHGPTVEQQTRAAIKYYRISGWRPWSCA